MAVSIYLSPITSLSYEVLMAEKSRFSCHFQFLVVGFEFVSQEMKIFKLARRVCFKKGLGNQEVVQISEPWSYSG